MILSTTTTTTFFYVQGYGMVTGFSQVISREHVQHLALSSSVDSMDEKESLASS